MTTISFKVNTQYEVDRAWAILKALDVLDLQKEEDETLMTEDEFVEMVEEGRRQIREGNYYTFTTIEDLEKELDSIAI